LLGRPDASGAICTSTLFEPHQVMKKWALLQLIQIEEQRLPSMHSRRRRGVLGGLFEQPCRRRAEKRQ
jgi:hypothetical protein